MRYLLLAQIITVEYNGKNYNSIGFEDDYILCDGKACRYDIVELTKTSNDYLIAMKVKDKSKYYDGVIAQSIVNLKDLNDVKVLCSEYSHSEVINNEVIKYHKVIVANNKCNKDGFNIKL